MKEAHHSIATSGIAHCDQVFHNVTHWSPHSSQTTSCRTWISTTSWHCEYLYLISLSFVSFMSFSSSSVQFSRSVVSDSLWPHESQHARPPCPSLSPRVHSDSCPSSPWCHPAISSWVVPFSSCPQSLPASKSFPMSQLFSWGGQSTGVSASVSFPPKKSQGWSPSEWTGWISLQRPVKLNNIEPTENQFSG